MTMTSAKDVGSIPTPGPITICGQVGMPPDLGSGKRRFESYQIDEWLPFNGRLFINSTVVTAGGSPAVA